jgi:hypothetical protein
VNRGSRAILAAATALLCSSRAALCADAAPAAPPDSVASPAAPSSNDVPWTNTPERPRLESLIPELAEHPYHLAGGTRPYEHRLSVSPGFGFFGADRLYSLRVTYHPNEWLGYEASLAHNPATAVHALIHTFSAVLRRPMPGRLQPYLSGGYGMIVVFPGLAVNASSVTKNALVAGGGLEFYVRDDLALRADLRSATLFGQQRGREGVVAYNYVQGTVGLAFYRSVRP